MLSEGEGTAAADAVKLYLIPQDELLNYLDITRGKLSDYAKVPDGATHFYRARQGEDDESWGVLGEIPK